MRALYTSSSFCFASHCDNFFRDFPRRISRNLTSHFFLILAVFFLRVWLTFGKRTFLFTFEDSPLKSWFLKSIFVDFPFCHVWSLLFLLSGWRRSSLRCRRSQRAHHFRLGVAEGSQDHGNQGESGFSRFFPLKIAKDSIRCPLKSITDSLLLLRIENSGDLQDLVASSLETQEIDAEQLVNNQGLGVVANAREQLVWRHSFELTLHTCWFLSRSAKCNS